MFRRKRTHLVKKLWKYRKGYASGEPTAYDHRVSSDDQLTRGRDHSFDEDCKSVIASIFKRLNETQLETLLLSLESRGGVETDCILFPTEEIVLGKRIVSPVLKLCQFFRFPEVRSTKWLKSLVCCGHHLRYATLKCANPYHYSTIIPNDTPSSPYSISNKQNTNIECDDQIGTMDRHSTLLPSETIEVAEDALSSSETTLYSKQIHRSLSTSCSFVSNFFDRGRCKTWPPRNDSGTDSWCKLAYWELRTRVGRIFDVTQICCNVFWELPQGDGFCLGLIDYLDPTPESVDRVRRHIGYGFQLTLEDDGIWIYNRSDFALFASSPSIQLEAINPKLPLVKRVPPGHSLRVFDYLKIKELRHLRDAYSSVDGPCDVYNVRVSFAKGWGINYTRRFITSCPSWIEIYINEKFVAKL